MSNKQREREDRLRSAIAYYLFERYVRETAQNTSRLDGMNEDKLFSTFMREFNKDAGITSRTEISSKQDAEDIIKDYVYSVFDKVLFEKGIPDGFRKYNVSIENDNIFLDVNCSNYNFCGYNNSSHSVDTDEITTAQSYNYRMEIRVSSLFPSKGDALVNSIKNGNRNKKLRCILAVEKLVKRGDIVDTTTSNKLYFLSQRMLYMMHLNNIIKKLETKIKDFLEDIEYNSSVTQFNKKYFGYSLVTLTDRRMKSILENIEKDVTKNFSREVFNYIMLDNSEKILNHDFVRSVAGAIKNQLGESIDNIIVNCLREFIKNEIMNKSQEITNNSTSFSRYFEGRMSTNLSDYLSLFVDDNSN